MRVTIAIFAALLVASVAVDALSPRSRFRSQRRREDGADGGGAPQDAPTSSSSAEAQGDADMNKPLYVLPMAPLEWKNGNLITNPFMNAVDPKVSCCCYCSILTKTALQLFVLRTQALENGRGPTPGQWAQTTGGSAIPPQSGNQAGMIQLASMTSHIVCVAVVK